MSDNLLEEKGFRQLLAVATDAMLVVDAQGTVAAMNPEAERLLGWTQAQLLGAPFDRIIPPRFQQVMRSRFALGEHGADTPPAPAPVGLFARRRDGTEFPVEINSSSLDPENDATLLVTIRDLTKWRRAQEALFQEKEQAVVTLASIADAVITTDLAGNISYLNPTAERLTGWRTSEALGQPLDTVLTLVSESTRQPAESITDRCLRERRSVDLLDGLLLLRRDGTEMAVGDSAAPLRDRNGATVGVVIVFHDATERRRAARRLSRDATHDSLTGLINRREFERRLAWGLTEASSGTAEHALCYLDLDRFKLVNDASGHEAGDNLLRRIGGVLAGQVRSRDTVGRIDGDEFGVLLEHCSMAKAREIAEGLRQAIEEFRFVWEGTTYSLSVSIGLVSITAASERMLDVLRAADQACYAAKEAGGNRVLVSQDAARGRRLAEEKRRLKLLTDAVEEGNFKLFVQPIIPLSSKRTARPRCEILLRLLDEDGGVESPDSFLPQAERNKLMPAIDRWVVRQTIALVSGWQRDHPECELPQCSVNLSASSLADVDFVSTVREYLTRHQLPPAALSFEIAEGAAFGNFAGLVRLISEIRAAGCGVGLDNFGSGLGSFAHLKALPVDFVKIGGHHVRGAVDDPVYGTIVSTVSKIGRIVGITTIAEGVETEAVLDRLRTLGVAYAQGHAVAPPAPLVDVGGNVTLPCVQRVA